MTQLIVVLWPSLPSDVTVAQGGWLLILQWQIRTVWREFCETRFHPSHITSSSAVQRDCTARCFVSVNSFNRTIRRTQVPLQIYCRVQINSVLLSNLLLTGPAHHRLIASYITDDRDLCLSLPPTLDAPFRVGGPRRNIAMMFGMKSQEWFGYPMVKKFWRYV